ncbi:hypothetical protein ABFX02_14G057800 [Erythranthe guttata]
MLLRGIRLHSLSLKPHFYALFSLSPLCTTPHSEHSNDAVFNVSALIKQPDWQNNIRLKSIVSHSNPQFVFRIISLHSRDHVPLCVDFFKWVCKQSTYCYDTDSRIQLLYQLASDNLYGIMHKVLVWLIKECSTSQDDLLKLMGAIEDMRENVGFRINYPCYSALLVCLAKLDMGSVSFLVFKRMSEDGFVAGGIDYRTVVNALCKNGFVHAAEMFVSRVLKLGFPLDVYIYTSLVLGNCRAGETGDAYKVFDSMSEKDGCGVNSATYSILMHGLCEARRLDEALKLKEEMCVKGCNPSTRTYTVLIKATCDKGLIDKALILLDEMTKKGCKPNAHTYTILVDMLCKEGKIEEANGMFRKMLKDGINPGTVTYNALINCYCKEGLVVSAFELLGVMERRQCKPNICTYNELIEGLCAIGTPYKAMELLRKVVNNGLFSTQVTFNILIVGFCRAGQIEMAFKILHLMSSIGIATDRFSYTALIDSLCKMGKMELAGFFLGLMIKKGIFIDEVALTALVHGYCKAGKTRSALMLLEEMVKDRCLTSPHTFNIFLDVLGKEVKLVEQNAILGKMLKHGLVPSVVTYTVLIDGLCRAGDVEASLEMIELMKRDSCPPNIYTYTIIIDGLCQVGKSNHAFEILRTMFNKGCRANYQIYFALLTGMTMKPGCSKSDGFIFTEMNIFHAFQFLDKIREYGGHAFDVYKFLITGLCRTGRISEGDIFIQEMVNHGLIPDSDICSCVITPLCKSGEYTRSLEWIKRFSGYGCFPSFACYSTVIVGLQSEGRFDEADWLISDLMRSAGVEDRNAVSPYIDFLVKGEGPNQSLELLNLLEQFGLNERPIV